jgi:hypothetical protein
VQGTGKHILVVEGDVGSVVAVIGFVVVGSTWGRDNTGGGRVVVGVEDKNIAVTKK